MQLLLALRIIRHYALFDDYSQALALGAPRVSTHSRLGTAQVIPQLWHIPSLFVTLSLTLSQCHNPYMGKCQSCGQAVAGSMPRHLAHCGVNSFVTKSLLLLIETVPHSQRAQLHIYILNRIYYVAAEQSYGKTCEEERQVCPVGNGLRQSLRALTVQ